MTVKLSVALLVALASPLAAQGTRPTPGVAGDYVIRDFRFASGERLPELRLHYLTLGQPRRDVGGDRKSVV